MHYVDARGGATNYVAYDGIFQRWEDGWTCLVLRDHGLYSSRPEGKVALMEQRDKDVAALDELLSSLEHRACARF